MVAIISATLHSHRTDRRNRARLNWRICRRLVALASKRKSLSKYRVNILVLQVQHANVNARNPVFELFAPDFSSYLSERMNSEL